MTHFTVFGGTGFIGTRLVRRLRATGADVQVPARGDLLPNRDLGVAFYCAGLTGDFRTRPFETVDAHVEYLTRVLRNDRFSTLVYLSSTRIYKRIRGVAREDTPISIAPTESDDLYGISKALGESIGFASGRAFKVVRLSNVYGPDLGSINFLSSLIRLAVKHQTLVLETSPESRRDYISVDDVVDLLVRIAEEGRHSIYNVASGQQVRTSDVVERLHQLTGSDIQVIPNAPMVHSPSIDITRIKEEFDFVPRDVLNDLPALVETYGRPTED